MVRPQEGGRKPESRRGWETLHSENESEPERGGHDEADQPQELVEMVADQPQEVMALGPEGR